MLKIIAVYRMVIFITLLCVVQACSAERDAASIDPIPPASYILPMSEPSPSEPPQPTAELPVAPTQNDASRFLMAASFGPTETNILDVVDAGYGDWIEQQFAMEARSIQKASWPHLTSRTGWREEYYVPLSKFYENAILGEDQLRMRAAYALSQIFVISTEDNDLIKADGEGLARYMDVLQEQAFGNFRDLLEEVTYNPMMGHYLTYAGNRKGNPLTGSMPDENYAREIMQLFTIGLYQLNADGTLKENQLGRPIETYDNDDVRELAKVFTGLWWDGLPFGKGVRERSQNSSVSRLKMYEMENEKSAKNFLGRSIPEGLSGNESIQQALDILFEHPNTAPFISKQLIQRLTTSNPSPTYVQSVATAFNTGEYRSADGQVFGEAKRGDLRAVWAAILLDQEFLNSQTSTQQQFGKIKEPVIRFTHWARMAGVSKVHLFEGTDTVVDSRVLNMNKHQYLGQRPFSSPTVFNFYRPGYTAPGSKTAEAGMVAPELQITNETSIVGYANFMELILFRSTEDGRIGSRSGILGSYSPEIEIAHDADALLDRLDLILMAGTMSRQTRGRLRMVIEAASLDIDDEKSRRDRVIDAVMLAVVSPEFLVQQ